MTEFLVVVGIALVAAFLTYLGVPVAERFDVTARVVNAALQVVAGLVTGAIALSLLAPIVRGISPLAVVLAFFIGGLLYVVIEYVCTTKLAPDPAEGSNVASAGLYVGILGEMLIDGMMIGIGATLSLAAGLQLAVGLSVSQTPLAFVATATAKTRGMSRKHRHWLGLWYFLATMASVVLGYLLLRNQPIEVRLTLIAVGCGFLLTAVTQGIIPESIAHDEPNVSGIFFIVGLTLYGLLTLFIK